MKLFESRRDPHYIEELSSKLSLWNEDGQIVEGGLIDSAIPLSKPIEINGKKYTKRIKIDFVGLAATTLFDKGENYTKNSVVDLIEEVFKNSETINNLGIQIKIRLLLVYPYSSFAFSFIQAETTTSRSSIEEEKELPYFHLTRQIEEKDFWGSNFVRSQKYSLEYLQELVDKYKWFPFHKENRNDIVDSRMIILRFTPINPSLCGLIINESVYYDSYQFSKDNRYTRKLSLALPLIRLNKFDEAKKAVQNYQYVLDHFRYLWRHDLTLDYEDATNYESAKRSSLGNIKHFTKINFRHKADRLKAVADDIGEKNFIQGLDNWRRKIARMLNQFCVDTSVSKGSETLFISCCWTPRPDGRLAPLREAELLNEWIRTDFKELQGEPNLTSTIVVASNTDFLSRQIYNALRNATLGIVFLTKDIPNAKEIKELNVDEDLELTNNLLAKDALQQVGDQYFSKPNLYHELGYLSHQLDFERLLIMREEEVNSSFKANIPSNISDFVRHRFELGRIHLIYFEVMQWLYGVDVMNSKKFAYVMSRHICRLKLIDLDKFIKLNKKDIDAEITSITKYVENIGESIDNEICVEEEFNNATNNA